MSERSAEAALFQPAVRIDFRRRHRRDGTEGDQTTEGGSVGRSGIDDLICDMNEYKTTLVDCCVYINFVFKYVLFMLYFCKILFFFLSRLFQFLETFLFRCSFVNCEHGLLLKWSDYGNYVR